MVRYHTHLVSSSIRISIFSRRTAHRALAARRHSPKVSHVQVSRLHLDSIPPNTTFSASFHPLTNRKHHCRLCGKIICSLPIKRPQRPEPCSILFIVDSKTRQIEHVGEGVDYGVKRRASAAAMSKGNGKQKEKNETLPDDEKFLKGVRICRDCKPILS